MSDETKHMRETLRAVGAAQGAADAFGGAQIKLTAAGRAALGGLVAGPVETASGDGLLHERAEAVRRRGFDPGSGMSWSDWRDEEEEAIECAEYELAAGTEPSFWLKGRTAAVHASFQIYGVALPCEVYTGLLSGRVTVRSIEEAVELMRDELRALTLRRREAMALAGLLEELPARPHGAGLRLDGSYGGAISLTPEALAVLLLKVAEGDGRTLDRLIDAAAEASMWAPVVESLRTRWRATQATARMVAERRKYLPPPKSGQAVELAGLVATMALELGDEVARLCEGRDCNDDFGGDLLGDQARDAVVEAARMVLGWCPGCYTLPGQRHMDPGPECGAGAETSVYWGRFAGGVGNGEQGCLLCPSGPRCDDFPVGRVAVSADAAAAATERKAAKVLAEREGDDIAAGLLRKLRADAPPLAGGHTLSSPWTDDEHVEGCPFTADLGACVCGPSLLPCGCPVGDGCDLASEPASPWDELNVDRGYTLGLATRYCECGRSAGHEPGCRWEGGGR